MDALTDDPAARRAQDEQDAFLLGYPSIAPAAAVLRHLYQHYTDTQSSEDSAATSAGGGGGGGATSGSRVARASEQLRVLQLLHAWLDPAHGYPEDLLSDDTAPCTAEVAAAEAELHRIVTAGI